MYRLDADYRHQLYMSGQETLVIINGDAPSALGAGVVLTLFASKDDHMPDAKYVGPTGTGIDAHRVAIEDERGNAATVGARLFDSEKKSAESGDASHPVCGSDRNAELDRARKCAGAGKGALAYCDHDRRRA